MDYFRNCMNPVEKLLRDAKISKDKVAEVVLVGGDRARARGGVLLHPCAPLLAMANMRGCAGETAPLGADAPAAGAGAKGENDSSSTSAELEGGVLTGAGVNSGGGEGGDALVATSLSLCVSGAPPPGLLASPRRRMSGRPSTTPSCDCGRTGNCDCSARRRGCNCDDAFCGVLHDAGECTNRMKKRSRRCAECIQNETDRKAARKAAAAKKKAESMCDCDGKCGRDGCDGGVCGNKVTQSRASKCTNCSKAVKKQRETCATCGDKTGAAF